MKEAREKSKTQHLYKSSLIPMSLGNPTFGGFVVGRVSRLPSNDLPTQARRLRYIQKSKKQAAFGISCFEISASKHPSSSVGCEWGGP
jgi:hypothetical protein